MQTTSSISPIWTTSITRTAPTWFPWLPSMLQPMGLYGGKQTTLDALEQ